MRLRTPLRRSLCSSSLCFSSRSPASGGYDNTLNRSQLKDAVIRLDEQPDALDWATYQILLRSCGKTRSIEEGRRVHAHICAHGFGSNTFLGNHIVQMYLRCGSLGEAQAKFDDIRDKDLVLWTAMVSGYAQNGHHRTALAMFRQMQAQGFRPDKIAIVSALQACTSPKCLDLGRQMHSMAQQGGFARDPILSSALVNMYGKCGSIEEARQVFDGMLEKNSVVWTALVAAYAQKGQSSKVSYLLRQMQLEGVLPDHVTFAAGLGGCSDPVSLADGKGIHDMIDKSRGCCWTVDDSDHVYVRTALLNMYGKCGSLEDAKAVFAGIDVPDRDLVCWNAMIGAYSLHGCSKEAAELFWWTNLLGLKPDVFTLISMGNVFASSRGIEQGRRIQCWAAESGLDGHLEMSNCLVNLFGKCGSVDEARAMFDQMKQQDTVSWNTMLAMYVQNGENDQALELFQRMVNGEPDDITLTLALNACGNLSALKLGRRLHDTVRASRYGSSIRLGNALVYMYGRCGCLGEARACFDAMPARDRVTWNTLVAAYAQHGRGDLALKLFNVALQEGLKPDEITFVSVLYACSHVGLVELGCSYFVSMARDYKLRVGHEHVGCIVDLLGRSGNIEAASKFLERSGADVNLVGPAWSALLGACKTQGDLEVGKVAAKLATEFEPQDSSSYVGLSNMYAAVGDWDGVARVRKLMDSRGVKKEPGRSSIEVDGRVHHFGVRDRKHPRSAEIYAELDRLGVLMRQAGYVPDTSLVLHNVDQHKKEELLAHHSERLAIAFGIVSSRGKGELEESEPIRIIKNLRVCADCHTATKFMSKIVGREIVVRDVNRFHYFKDGQCSCHDYW